MTIMLNFEIKKIFSKARNKVAMTALLAILLVVSLLSINKVEYMDENGNHTTGITAAQNLRREKNKWAGDLTEDVFREVYQKNHQINSEQLNDSIEEEDKAFQKKQGISSIIDIINDANSPWRDYDYYAIDRITEDEAANVYEERIANLKDYINGGEESFSDHEKDYLLTKYQNLRTPFHYEYYDGWVALIDNIPTFIMILALFIGFFVSGIFSDEFQTKADSVLFSTKLGRNKAIRSKISAGFMISTVLYAAFIGIHTAIVLLILGAGGADCPIQMIFWRSCYNITILQGYLFIVLGGYIGTLFASTAAMLVSVLTRSTVIAIIVPFIILCFFPFLSRIIPLPEICSFFPDRLLDIYNELRDFELLEVCGNITTVSKVIIPAYAVISLLLLPVIYQFYKKAEIK